MPSRRILFVTSIFTPHTETFIYSDIIGLARQNDAKALCLERQNLEKFPFGSVIVVPYHRKWLMQKIWTRLFAFNISMNFFNRTFHKSLKSIVKNFQPEVIHCYFGPLALQLIDNLRATNIPVIVNFLGYDASIKLKKSKIYTRRIKSLLKEPFIYPTANSDSLFDYLKEFEITSKHSRKIYLGVDTDFFQRTRPLPKDDPFTFLQVAGFREKKGHIYTLEAFKRFLAGKNKRNFRLILVGGGNLEHLLKARCADLGITEQVVFAGWGFPEKVKDYLEQAHCFIHPSITPDNGDKEGMPVAIKEAMSMELPIIATYHSGIPELVESGTHGILVEEKNIGQYVDAMNRILDWGLQPQNRQRIISHFSQAKRLKELQAFYEFAIEQMHNKKSK